MEIEKCPICNSKQLSFFLMKNDCDFSKCRDCGLVFMNPQPTVEGLVNDFLTEKCGYHSKLNKDLTKIKKHRNFFVGIIDKLIKMGARGNLLDVGCSNGELMFLAKENGFDVYGVEVNKDTAKIAVNNGLNVFLGTLQEANFQSDYFSVICLMGVVEDIPDIPPLLKECHRILKKGGTIVISTPNLDCFWARATEKLNKWFKFPWSVIIPYYRLFVFSDSNLRNLLLKLRFKIKKIDYPLFPLKHELAATGLFAKFKKKKSIGALSYMISVFSAYSLVYFINFLSRPILNKDFKMVFFAEK